MSNYYTSSSTGYGAIPPLVSAFSANAIPNVNISPNTGGYTIGGFNGASNTNAVWTTNTTAAGNFHISDSAAGLDASGKLSLNGKNADISINGKSLKDWMEKVEERLAILHPNEKLEDQWEELKELGIRYRALEAEIIEKEKVWATLKNTDI